VTRLCWVIMLASCKLETSQTMPSWGKLSTLRFLFELISWSFIYGYSRCEINWESYEIMEFVYVLEKCMGHQSKPCIIHDGNLQHAHSEHSTTHLKIKSYTNGKYKRCRGVHCLFVLSFWCGLVPCHWARRYPVGGSRWYMYTYNDKSLLGTLSRVAWGLGIRTSRDTRFSTYNLSSICFIIVLTLTLTIQDAYDGGNESSKLVSTIIFEGL
jgi:hypothetical protein